MNNTNCALDFYYVSGIFRWTICLNLFCRKAVSSAPILKKKIRKMQQKNYNLNSKYKLNAYKKFAMKKQHPVFC